MKTYKPKGRHENIENRHATTNSGVKLLRGNEKEDGLGKITGNGTGFEGREEVYCGRRKGGREGGRKNTKGR